jgi:AbrB family looped-hinge helix DNA binding protein
MVKSKAKLSSKGQLTIPAGIRDALGLKKGDVLSLELRDEGLLIRRPVMASSLRGRFPALKGDWKTIRDMAWSKRLDEIMRRSSATRTSSSDS